MSCKEKCCISSKRTSLMKIYEFYVFPLINCKMDELEPSSFSIDFCRIKSAIQSPSKSPLKEYA